MMNNASINEEYEEGSATNLPALREQMTRLTELIEALNNIQASSYWKVLKQYVFDVDLLKAKRRLASEESTTEIFRLQGELRWDKKLSLDKLLIDKRNELEKIKRQI